MCKHLCIYIYEFVHVWTRVRNTNWWIVKFLEKLSRDTNGGAVTYAAKSIFLEHRQFR